MRNVRHVEVSPLLLARSLNMPDGSDVIDAQWDSMYGVVRLFVSHPSFPDTPEGCQVDRATLMVTTQTRKAQPEDFIHSNEGKWV